MEDNQWDTSWITVIKMPSRRGCKSSVKSSALDLQILRPDRSPGAILTVLLGQESMRTNRGFPFYISVIMNLGEQAL
jgi:hypothetical protein